MDTDTEANTLTAMKAKRAKCAKDSLDRAAAWHKSYHYVMRCYVKDEEKLSWRYNTGTFVRRACSCKYKYAGVDEKTHKTVYFDDACDATTAIVV